MEFAPSRFFGARPPSIPRTDSARSRAERIGMPEMKLLALLAGVLLSFGSAHAQSKACPEPVVDADLSPCGDAPFAGTFHVATGTFEPAGMMQPAVTPGVIYNNTVYNSFFLATLNGTTVL